MLNELKARLPRMSMKTREQAWEEDPLMHPDIRAMDLNQIADLPMWAGRCRDDGAKSRRRSGSGYDKPCEAKGGIRSGRGRLSIAVPLMASLFAGGVATVSDAAAQDSGKEAAFAMPADFDQWRPDIFGQNGAYRFRQVDGNCQITFGQNRGADAARAAGREPRHGIDAYIDRVSAQVGKVERAEVDALQIKSDLDESVPFVSAEFAYLGKDGVEYHNRISMAWVGNVELLIVAACPAAEWLSSQSPIDVFIDKVSIARISNP